MVRFWDNLMRKKGIFLILLAVFALASLVSYNFLTNQAKTSKNHPQNSINVAEQPSSGYVNSLIIRIQNGYELTFTENFTKAQVKVTDATLENPASVRIFDKNGKLIVGEYTTMVEPETPATQEAEYATNDNEASDIDDNLPGSADASLPDPADVDPSEPLPIQYRLSGETKSYTIDLEIGTTIEITSPDMTIISSLSGSVAQSFMPTGDTETYVVMLSGLRKSTWDVKQGNAEMYGLVRDYFASALRQYEAEMPDEVLNNKNLDTKDKAQALIAYYQLVADDQAEFRDFVENIQRGGSPQINYDGRTEFSVGEEVNFVDSVVAIDPEDGEIEKITVQTDADLAKAGDYYLTITATDSDKNSSTLNINIAVVDNYASSNVGVPADKNQDDDGKGEVQDFNTGVSSLYPNSITTIISSLAAEQEALRNNVAEAAEDEPAASAETPVEESSSTVDTTPVSQPVVNYTESTHTAAAAEKATGGLKIWQIALGLVGIVVILGLIRFISDHYVR